MTIVQIAEGQQELPLGLLGMTPGVAALMRDSIPNATALMSALQRHTAGDWGDVNEHDAAANDAAVAQGSRVLSAYRMATGEKFWIITEADRTVTTVLLPGEY